MLSKLSSCGISLIILLCWLNINDAVPHGPYPADEVHPTASLQSQVSNSTKKKSTITEPSQSISESPKPVTDSFRPPINANRRNINFNSNINVNYVHARPLKPAENNPKTHGKQPINHKQKIDIEPHSSEQFKNNNTDIPDRSISEPETKKVSDKREETTEKCVNEARRQNQTYTRSFPLNISSIDLANEFKIAGEAEAKKSSSVHVGEDIALCWIETTTIKEDPSFEPPKRLVIREFTISFENSATIPDHYLECDKLEGEIAPGDAATVGKTSLNEMIDENTKRSRVVNFTSVHRIGPIVVTQHKKVRCGVGAVVSKDIYEWPDATDNPKKRVEIKVGPSIRDLGAGSPEESGECATDDVPKSPKVDQSSSASSDCTSGEDCKEPSTSTACEGDDCSTKSLPETTYPPDSNDLLATGVTRRTATKISEEPLVGNDSSATPSPHKSDQAKGDPCVEGDAVCISRKIVEKTESATDGPKQGKGDLEESTTDGSSESCQGSSEDCSCSGDSCSIHSSEETSSLETGNKQTDVTTVSPGKASSNTLSESTKKSSKATPAPLKDSKCEFGGCSTSSGVSLEVAAPTATGATPGKNVSGDGEPVGINEVSITSKNTDGEATTEQFGNTKLSETIGVTEESGSSKVSSNTESLPLCDDPNSKDCVTATPGHNDLSDGRPKEKNGNSSKLISTETPVTKKEDPGNSRLQETSSRNTNSTTESGSFTTVPSEKEFEEGSNSATSEAPEGVTNGLNDTTLNSATTTSIIESTDGLPESRNSSRLEKGSTECSLGSESGDCGGATTSSTLGEGETILPSNKENATLSPEEILTSTTANEIASTNATTKNATPKKSNQSTCDESTESCESSSSDSGSEKCEDGSSGSCSSELTDPVAGIADNAGTTTIDATVITTTEATVTMPTEFTVNELENASTTIDNVSTTAETRRNTVPNLFLTPPPSKGRRRLALRIKVLLEHINENKEKEKLVQVEKQLLLNENPDDRGNHSLLWQIKSLNNTMNVETLKAIFNCSVFEEIAEGVGNATKYSQWQEESASLKNKVVNSSLVGTEEENSNSKHSTSKNLQRKKREIPIPQLDVVKRKNITEAKATAIRESLPGVEEDFKKGLNHVMSRISKELDAPKSGGVGKVAESSSSSILKLLASPKDPRIHSRRRRRTNKVGSVVFVEEPKNLVKGEEIDRWSNERLVNAADGGKVRTVTEFKLLRDAVGDSRKVSLGS